MAGSLGGNDVRDGIGARGSGLGDLKVLEFWISQVPPYPLQWKTLDHLGHVGQKGLGRSPQLSDLLLFSRSQDDGLRCYYPGHLFCEGRPQPEGALSPEKGVAKQAGPGRDRALV